MVLTWFCLYSERSIYGGYTECLLKNYESKVIFVACPSHEYNNNVETQSNQVRIIKEYISKQHLQHRREHNISIRYETVICPIRLRFASYESQKVFCK